MAYLKNVKISGWLIILAALVAVVVGLMLLPRLLASDGNQGVQTNSTGAEETTERSSSKTAKDNSQSSTQSSDQPESPSSSQLETSTTVVGREATPGSVTPPSTTENTQPASDDSPDASTDISANTTQQSANNGQSIEPAGETENSPQSENPATDDSSSPPATASKNGDPASQQQISGTSAQTQTNNNTTPPQSNNTTTPPPNNNQTTSSNQPADNNNNPPVSEFGEWIAGGGKGHAQKGDWTAYKLIGSGKELPSDDNPYLEIGCFYDHTKLGIGITTDTFIVNYYENDDDINNPDFRRWVNLGYKLTGQNTATVEDIFESDWNQGVKGKSVIYWFGLQSETQIIETLKNHTAGDTFYVDIVGSVDTSQAVEFKIDGVKKVIESLSCLN